METLFTSGQLAKAMKVMEQKGMTPGRFNWLLSSGIFADVCDSNAVLGDRKAVRQALKLDAAISEEFDLIVDDRLTFEKMVEKAEYACMDASVNDRTFPIRRNRQGEVHFIGRLFEYDRQMTSHEAGDLIRGSRMEGWEPADVEHLLVFGYTYPAVQLTRNIVAPNVRGRKGTSVLYLGGHDNTVQKGTHSVPRPERQLCRETENVLWKPGTAFLAVHRAE